MQKNNSSNFYERRSFYDKKKSANFTHSKSHQKLINIFAREKMPKLKQLQNHVSFLSSGQGDEDDDKFSVVTM